MYAKKRFAIDIIYSVLAVVISALLLYGFTYASDHVHSILLYPHAKLVEVFYNIDLHFYNGIGYCDANGLFVIGPECMGLRFIVLMFCMHVIMFVKYYTGKILWFGATLISSVIIGVIVSGLRIIGSIPIVSHEKFTTLHTGIGIALYLFVLIASYMLVKKRIGARYHEKDV